MKRRNFIKNTAIFGSGSLLLNRIPVKGMAIPRGLPSFTCAQAQNRILVLVNLFGANDTLNTVIPVEYTALYHKNRPNIGIPDSAVSILNPTDPVAKQVKLHPSLITKNPTNASLGYLFQDLWAAGKLNIVNGVGFANNNKSHFKSDALYNTAGDSTPANFNFESGWAGQLFEAKYPGLLGTSTAAMPDPPCIELGATNGSLLFSTSTGNNSSILLTQSDLSAYYTNINTVAGVNVSIPPSSTDYAASDYATELQYIASIQATSNAYAGQITNRFNAGKNSTTITYPNSDLAAQLQTVAKLISGGATTNIYMVHQFGFDTHINQVNSGAQTTGTQASLLTDLAEALTAFQLDIEALGYGDQVVSATYSEFGRTIDENSGLGTDHGGVSTMFVVGKGILGGISGTAINLNITDGSRGLSELQFDYRQVWKTILQDFMANNDILLAAARMEAGTAPNLPKMTAELINPSYVVPPDCYGSSILPITLVNFTAQRIGNTSNAIINWESESEINCKNYQVEWSTNAMDWTTIGNVAGNGTTTAANKYQINYPNLLEGDNYFRLWQINTNGDKTIFGPVMISLNDDEFRVKAYPNPAKVDFNIEIITSKAQTGDIQFFDIQGHLFSEEQIKLTKGYNKFNIQVSRFNGYAGEIIIHILPQYSAPISFKHIVGI